MDAGPTSIELIDQIKISFFVHLKDKCMHEKMTGPTFDQDQRGQVGASSAGDRDCGHRPTDQIRSAEQVRQWSWISSAAAQLPSDGRQQWILRLYGGEDHRHGGANHH